MTLTRDPSRKTGNVSVTQDDQTMRRNEFTR